MAEYTWYASLSRVTRTVHDPDSMSSDTNYRAGAANTARSSCWTWTSAVWGPAAARPQGGGAASLNLKYDPAPQQIVFGNCERRQFFLRPLLDYIEAFDFVSTRL